MGAGTKKRLWLLLLAGALLGLFMAQIAAGPSWLDGVRAWMDGDRDTGNSVIDDDDDDDHEELAPLTVRLEGEALHMAGVETRVLAETRQQSEYRAHAVVLSLRELVQWRSRINQARAAVGISTVTEAATRAEHERLKKLAQGAGSVANKNVIHAEAEWRQASANLQATRFALQDEMMALRQDWDEPVASWVLDSDSQEFERLVSHQDLLLLVALPIGETLPADVSIIQVAREGGRAAARKAYFVSPAHVTPQAVQGEAYYFRIAAGKLRSGMRLDAWIAAQDEPISGFYIPEQAIVWYAGQPWCYVETGPGLFTRRPLAAASEVAGGLFMTTGFANGDRLVVSGVQMLLSEEFRWQIHDEDDDD